MAYLGQGAEGNFTTTNAKDTFSGNGSTTTFTLSQRGTENNVDVFVNNVRQEPNVAYNIEGNGTSLVFTAAPSLGTNNIYVVNRGPAELSASHPASQALAAYSGDFTTDVTIGGDLTVDTDTLYVDSTNNKVGIGTSSPTVSGSAFTTLNVKGNAFNTGLITVTSNDLGSSVQLYSGNSSSDNPAIAFQKDLRFGSATDAGVGGFSERMRIQSGGGISFNGDTAAANALDDYEEGTWTPTLRNGPAIQIIYSARYVKVGNLCTATLFINIAGNTDNDPIEPTLPFTAANITSGYWAGSIGYNTSGNADETVLVTPNTNVFTIRVAATGTTRKYNQYSGDSIIATVTYQTA